MLCPWAALGTRGAVLRRVRSPAVVRPRVLRSLRRGARGGGALLQRLRRARRRLTSGRVTRVTPALLIFEASSSISLRPSTRSGMVSRITLQVLMGLTAAALVATPAAAQRRARARAAAALERPSYGPHLGYNFDAKDLLLGAQQSSSSAAAAPSRSSAG